jgi:hypothetical protein
MRFCLVQQMLVGASKVLSACAVKRKYTRWLNARNDLGALLPSGLIYPCFMLCANLNQCSETEVFVLIV